MKRGPRRRDGARAVFRGESSLGAEPDQGPDALTPPPPSVIS